MKKKILTMIVGLMATMAVNAQSTYDTPPFGQGKIYVGASMSSFDIGSVMSKFHVDLNGIFLGAGAKLVDMTNDLDFQPNISLGYAFFLNRTVTVEPELYFNLSTKDIDNSSYGFRIGFGVYLFNE